MEINNVFPHYISTAGMYFINLKGTNLKLGDWIVNQRGEVFQIMELALYFGDDYYIKGLCPDFLICPGDSYSSFKEVWKQKGKIINLHKIELYDFCKEEVSKLPKWEKEMEVILDYSDPNLCLLNDYGERIRINKIIGK